MHRPAEPCRRPPAAQRFGVTHFNDMYEQTFKVFFSSSCDVCAEEELLLRRNRNYPSKTTYLAQTNSPGEEDFLQPPPHF